MSGALGVIGFSGGAYCKGKGKKGNYDSGTCDNYWAAENYKGQAG